MLVEPGKTVLAQQAGRDERIRAAYPGGRWWMTVGEHPDLERLAVELYRKLSGGRQPAVGLSAVTQLGDAVSDQPVLVILDDVWPPTDQVEQLLAALPANAHCLVTTRGANLSGSVPVSVGELTLEEARQVLLAEYAATTSDAEVIRCVDDLARLLGRWALLLVMAGGVVRSQLGGSPANAVAALQAIASDFSADPTVLDDADRRERSFGWIIERSEASLRGRGGPDGRDLQRFWELGVYPADAELDVQLLADLWGCSGTQALRSAQRITEAGLTSIRLPTQTRPLTVVVHDLIVDYLHRERCRPGQFAELHRRCAAPSIGLDGHPLDLSPARARWLVHHLVSAGEWVLLEKMASLRWRGAFLDCTGSDAAFFDALDSYASAALEHLDPVEAASHYFSAVLLAAHVRAVIGEVPIAALTTHAVLGNPFAALVQTANRPDAGTALPAVLAAASTAGTVSNITGRAVELAGIIPDDLQRCEALAAIAQQVAASDPVLAAELVARAVELAGALPDETVEGRRIVVGRRSKALAAVAKRVGASDPVLAAGLVERAVELAGGIRDDWQRWEVLSAIAQQVTAVDPADPARIAQAVELAATIAGDWQRSDALAAIAEQLAAVDPADPARITQAVELAATIPEDQQRSDALAAIAEQVVAGGPADPARIEQAVELAATIPEGRQRCEALSAIAQHVAASDPTLAAEFVAWAVELAWDIPNDEEVDRDMALATIARRAAAGDPADAELVAHAVELAETIPDEGSRSEALADIAEQVAASDPVLATELIARAVELAGAIANDWQRSEALAAIAEQLAARNPADAESVARAVMLAGTISGHTQRSTALAAIAKRVVASDPALAAELVSRAMELARITPSDWTSSEALATTAEQLAARDLANAELVAQAVELARIIPELRYDRRKSQALAAIAQQVAATGPAGAEQMAWAVELAGTIPDEGWRSVALAEIAQQVTATNTVLAAELVAQAVGLARTLDDGDDGERSWALGAIAQRVADSDPADAGRIAQAVELAGTIPETRWRSWALGAIAQKVVASDPVLAAELVDRAVELARTIPDDHWRSWALAALADQLAGSDPADAERIAQAVELAGTIPNDGQRTWSLGDIARKAAPTDPVLAAELVDQAVALARTIPGDRPRTDALIALTQQVVAADPADASRVAQAVDLTGTIPDDQQKSHALAAIARQVAAANPDDAARVAQAMELAKTMPDEQLRNEALAEIAGASGDLTGFASSLSWRTTELNRFLNATESFASLARSTHPDIAFAASMAVCRTAVAFAATEPSTG